MTADLRRDISPGDSVTLLLHDGSRLVNQRLTGTDRWVNPGNVPFESLDYLLNHGWVVESVLYVRQGDNDASEL